MIQTGLIALFGIYLVIPGLLAKLGFKYPKKIHRHFRAANFLMATSFFVAEVWHLSQSPGIVETDFMRMLAELQTIQYTVITYGVVAALGAFGERTSSLSIGQLLSGGDSLRIIDLSTPLFPIAYLILDGSNYGDPGSWQQALANACPDTYNANEGLAAQDAGISGIQISCVELKTLMSDVLFRYSYSIIMGLQLLCGFVFGMLWYGSRCFVASDNGLRAHVKRYKWWYRMVLKAGLTICILLTAALVLGLWLYRTCVDKVVDYREDNQWSIGQVLAPAAWVPSILDIAKWMYGCFRYRGRESTLAVVGLKALLTVKTLGMPEGDEKSHSRGQYPGLALSTSGATSPAVPESSKAKGPWV